METHQDQDIAEKFVEMQRWSVVAEYLWSRRVGVLLWTLAGAVLSAIVAWRVCKFEATVQLMPPDAPGGLAALALPNLMKSPGLAGLSGMAGDLLGMKSTGALFVKVLQSRRVEDNLINAKDLRKVYGVRYMEDARSKLEWRTTISEDKKSGVISVSVRDRDAKLAAELADLYRQQLGLVMMEVSTSAARREREFIEKRLQEEKKQLDEAEQRFSKFASNSMALDIPQQTRVMVESAARLQGELIAARAEMEGLEQIYTSENVRVKTLKARVNELQKEMNKINKGGPVKAQPGDSSTEYPSVKNLPLVGIEWTDLYRNTKIHETVFELLTQQYEVARIQEARDFPTVKVLDEAEVPEKRHPRPWTVISLGALAGGLLACLGAFLQYRWQSWGEDDPRRVMIASLFRKKREFTASLGTERRA